MDNCFWKTGCSNTSRCGEFGECVALHQNKHKADISRGLIMGFDEWIKEYKPDNSGLVEFWNTRDMLKAFEAGRKARQEQDAVIAMSIGTEQVAGCVTPTLTTDPLAEMIAKAIRES